MDKNPTKREKEQLSIDELQTFIQHASKNCQNIMVAGDLNCPNIDLNPLTFNNNARDRDVEMKRIGFTTTFNLTQTHEQPTRENNHLGIVLTTNPSLVKTSAHVPVILNPKMVVTECNTKPCYQYAKARISYIFSNANWEEINKTLRKHH